ncbi:MAG: TonB-dependent receptor [Proteobacteria bacterium]|nr:TonB-dependent receptor [Pseudomonadota bacterium]
MRDSVGEEARARVRRVAAGCGAALLACPALGAAEEPEAAVPRATITALRLAELPEDPSSFTTTLETDAFAGEHRTTDELVSRSVGVQVRRFGDEGRRQEVAIRGSSPTQVVVLLDGVRLNSAQSGSVDLSTLPLSLVDRIEISRGGGGAQLGTDAVGGAINVVTRRVGDEPIAEAGFRGGSFGTWRGSLQLGRRFGQSDLLLGYDGFSTDGDWEFQTGEFEGDGAIELGTPGRTLERINNDSESHAGLMKLRHALGDGFEATLSNHVFFVSQGQPGVAPASGFVGGQSETAHERRVRNVAVGSLLFEPEDGWLQQAALRLFHRYERTRFREPAPVAGPRIDTDDRNQSLGAKLSLEAEAETWGVEHVALATLEQRRDSLVSNQFTYQRRWVFGAFLQDELGFFDRRLRLTPGVRYDRSEGFGDRWVPRLGIVVEPFTGVRAKANVEESYRIPNFDELFFPDKRTIRGNPGLRPEEAFNWDVGIELGLETLGPLSDVRLEVAYFDHDIENSIVFQSINAQTLAPTNTNDAFAKGVELSGSVGFRRWLRLSGNWTHQETEVRRTEAALVGRADDEFSLRLEGGLPSRELWLVIERHHTSRIVTDEAGSTAPARTVYDVRAALDAGPRLRKRWHRGPEALRFTVAANNVTDRSVRDSRNVPQPGRTWIFGLEVER